MIVPGKDNNYPGNTGTSAWSFMPHTIVGMLLALIIIMLAYHLLKGTVRHKR
jgi:hypothetical protein